MANDLPSAAPFSTGLVVAVVMIHDEIIADASASSGKNAKVKASEKAIRLLDGLLPFEFRRRFCCDCEAIVEDSGGGGAREVKVEVGVEVGSAI